MLVPANSPIPQNSLMPPPADDQLAQAYRAAQVIAAGYTARAASSCGAPADSFAALGGNVLVQEVLTEQQTADQYLSNQTQILAPAISQMSGQGAIISDSDIANAPQIVTPGGVVFHHASADCRGDFGAYRLDSGRRIPAAVQGDSQPAAFATGDRAAAEHRELSGYAVGLAFILRGGPMRESGWCWGSVELGALVSDRGRGNSGLRCTEALKYGHGHSGTDAD